MELLNTYLPILLQTFRSYGALKIFLSSEPAKNFSKLLASDISCLRSLKFALIDQNIVSKYFLRHLRLKHQMNQIT